MRRNRREEPERIGRSGFGGEERRGDEREGEKDRGYTHGGARMKRKSAARDSEPDFRR